MKDQIKWLKDALATKEIIVTMASYCLKDRELKATDGCVVAGHPWDQEGEACIPGAEIEKIVSRLNEDPTISLTDKTLTIKSGDFKARLAIFPVDQWNYPGPEKTGWKPIPEGFVEGLAKLRPFISDNASQPWATCVYLENGFGYATNNVAIACVPFSELKRVKMLVPHWAIDFLIHRPGVTHWQPGEESIAFQWDNGAWMRSQLVSGIFPLNGVKLAQDAHNSTKTLQPIDEPLRAAFARLNGLIEGPLSIYANKVEGKFRDAMVEEKVVCAVPKDTDHSLWGVEYLEPVMKVATHWDPAAYPRSVFKGENISGVIMGRTK